MLIKYCCDCSREIETEYCGICNGWVCDECDPEHDCLAEELRSIDADASDEDLDALYDELEERELEAAFDDMLDEHNEDDDGHA